jgi:hypothetical protein
MRTGSAVFSFPRSSKTKIEPAMNCFVTEAILNLLVDEFGMFHSASACHSPLDHGTLASSPNVCCDKNYDFVALRAIKQAGGNDRSSCCIHSRSILPRTTALNSSGVL